MKKIFSVFLLIAIFFLSFSITSCGEKSAKNRLNENELTIYSSLASNIFSFKSPTSVKILSVAQHSNSSVIINLSAENEYGANISQKYYLFTKDYTSPSGKFGVKKYHLENCESLNERFAAATMNKYSDINEALDFINSKPSINTLYSTKRLNEALEEFKDSLGW